MRFDEIKNTSQREFKDISSEEYRRYVWPEGIVFIPNPIGLSVSKSGHYVIDSDGVTHFIPFGFIELAWKAKNGQANVVT